MQIHGIYIGENRQWSTYLKRILDDDLKITDSPFKASSYIFEHLYEKHPVFIFIEATDTKFTIKRIGQFSKNKSQNHYLVLVGEKFPRPTLLNYMKSGIDEIIDPGISKDNLRQVLTFLPRIQKQKHSEDPIRTFKLPLWKRTFDIVFSFCASIALFPLFLFTALAIRLESRGPILYTSKRVGSNYKIFGFLKFRSMYADADKRLQEFKDLNQYRTVSSETETIVPEEDTTIFIGDDFHLTEKEYFERRKKQKDNNFVKFKDDPRITRVGYFIRKFSIDELPQLFNILKGDMSVVGNRPLPLYEAEQLTSDEYIERFMGPAGLTGLWQVEKRGTEGILSPEERKQLDIIYARKFSFWLDIKIILRTFTAFIQKENV